MKGADSRLYSNMLLMHVLQYKDALLRQSAAGAAFHKWLLLIIIGTVEGGWGLQ